jgi:DNA-binding NarL/FixJ family response regulator
MTLDLTNRERQVWELMAEGLSNRGIGERLHLGERAIEKISQELLWKTTGRLFERRALVNRRVLAVLRYHEENR